MRRLLPTRQPPTRQLPPGGQLPPGRQLPTMTAHRRDRPLSHELTKPKSTFWPQNFLSGLRVPHEQSFPFPTVGSPDGQQSQWAVVTRGAVVPWGEPSPGVAVGWAAVAGGAVVPRGGAVTRGGPSGGELSGGQLSGGELSAHPLSSLK